MERLFVHHPTGMGAAYGDSVRQEWMRHERDPYLRRKARLFVAGLAVLAAMLLALLRSCGTSPAQGPWHASTDMPSGYAGSANPSAAQQFAAQVGAPVPYVTEFLDATSWDTIADPSWLLQQWAGKGFSMIWSVPILPYNGATLAAGASGAYDAHFTALAGALVAGGQQASIVRIGWEFNGFWYPWAAKGHAAQFIAYWRHIVTAMRSVPGANFKFEWDPNRGDLGVGNLTSYYPGDQYVDYVGLDVYDVEDFHYPGAQAEFATSRRDRTASIGWPRCRGAPRAHGLSRVGPGWGTCRNGAPVFVKSGGVCGGDNPVFIRDSSVWFKSHHVFEVTYWDYGTSRVTATHNVRGRVALRTYWAPLSTMVPSPRSTRGAQA